MYEQQLNETCANCGKTLTKGNTSNNWHDAYEGYLCKTCDASAKGTAIAMKTGAIIPAPLVIESKGYIEAKISEPEAGKFIFIYHSEDMLIPLEICLDCAPDKYADKLTFKWKIRSPNKHDKNPREEVYKVAGKFREKPRTLIRLAEEITPRIPFDYSELKEALELIDNYIAKYDLFQSQQTEHPSEEMSEVDRERAMKILEDPELLHQVLKATDWGVVGEEDTRLGLFLILATSKLPKKVNVQITGESSAGKTWVKNRVLRLFPPENVESFSRITSTALDHATDIDWDGKILDIAESEGVMQAIEIIKHYTDDSGGGSRLLIPEKDEKTAAYTSKIKESKGIPVFVTTTAKIISDYEFTNRLINIPVDLSEEQTEGIHAYQKGFAAQPWEYDEDEEWAQDFQNAFRLLEVREVVIPYAKALDITNPKIVRSRRDLNKVIWLIEASALVHQYQRYTLTVNDIRYIIANFQDLLNAMIIYKRGFQRTFDGLHASTVKVKKELERLGDQLFIHEQRDAPYMCFTAIDIVRISQLGWTTKTLYPHLNNLHDIGYLGKLKKGREGFFWVLGDGNSLRRSCRQLSPLRLLKEGQSMLESYKLYSSDKPVAYRKNTCNNVTENAIEILHPNNLINPLCKNFCKDTTRVFYLNINDLSDDYKNSVDWDSDLEKQLESVSILQGSMLETIEGKKEPNLTPHTNAKKKQKTLDYVAPPEKELDIEEMTV